MSAPESYTWYESGYMQGLAEGRRQADHEASVKWAGYLPIVTGGPIPDGYPTLARAPHREAKPLPTPAECLASWEVTA